MKVCKKCGEINEDERTFCKNQNCLSREFTSYYELKNKSLNKLSKREGRKRALKFLVIGIYIVLFIISFIVNFKNLSISSLIISIISAVVGFMLIYFTGLFFEIMHMFSLKDSSYENMSDMYDTYLKLGGVLSLIYSIYNLFS